MRVIINPGFVTVDRDTRAVQTDDLIPAGIAQISFDQDRGRAWVEYGEDETVQIMDRDLDNEYKRNEELRRNNKPESGEPLYKPVRVRRPGHWLADLTLIDQLLARWEANPPPPPPAPPPEPTLEQVARDQEIKEFTLGSPVSKTASELEAMTRAEFRDWFNTNVAPLPGQQVRVLRWLLWLAVRRFR